MSISRKTVLTMEIQVMKSEHTQAVPVIRELQFAVADINQIIVGWHPDPSTPCLCGEIDIDTYAPSIQLNGITPSALFAKQFAAAQLTDIVYDGPRFRIISMEYRDTLTGSCYSIPKHKFQKVNQLIAQRK